MNWEIGIDIYTLLCIKQITNENRLYSTGKSSVFCGELNGKEIQKRRGICIHIADSLRCAAKTNTTS